MSDRTRRALTNALITDIAHAARMGTYAETVAALPSFLSTHGMPSDQNVVDDLCRRAEEHNRVRAATIAPR